MSLSLAAVVSTTAFAAKPIAGPKGGKILTSAAPHVEFFIQPDRTVSISFYDADLKPSKLAGQEVTAIAEAKSGKVSLSFKNQGDALISNSPLPEGDGYRIVVQVRDTAGARPKNYRVEFHDENCETCKRAEYACICEDAGSEHGHKH